MSQGYKALSDKEKETLRLILHGHDAKSMAQELALSVHTINERLRSARRKLEVTSSKEAARLLLQEEGDAPQFLADKSLGDEPGHGDAADQDFAKAGFGPAWKIGAILMLMTFTILTLAAVLPPETAGTRFDLPVETRESSAEQPMSSELDQAKEIALLWLGLVDREDFVSDDISVEEADLESGNLAGWSKLIDRRREFGRAVQREAQRIDIISGTDQDRWIVRFRTDFERLRGAYEKVTLVEHEGTFVTADYEFE